MDPESFILAASYGDESEARQALEANSQLAAARNDAGVSVIATTAYAQRLPFARELASHRDDLDLFEAACLGDVHVVRARIEVDPEVIDHHSPDGFSAIGFAAYLGHLDLLVFLIEHGADLELPSTNAMRVRPLHSAAAHSDPSRATLMARTLLEAGADPNAQQQGGFTPLHEAVHNDNLELTRLLLSHGGNPHVSNDDGDSALQVAHAENKTHSIELIEKTIC
jgi:ankyrin repeat protein